MKAEQINNIIDWAKNLFQEFLALFRNFYHDVYKKEAFDAESDVYPVTEG